MKVFNLTRYAIAMATVTTMLSACGDSSNLTPVAGTGNPPPASIFVNGTEVPIAATTSSAGATEFIKGIVSAGGSETTDPLVAGDAVLAISETDEPDQTI